MAKKTTKALGLGRMTQEEADRLNSGGVQMRASYRSRLNTAKTEVDRNSKILKAIGEIMFKYTLGGVLEDIGKQTLRLEKARKHRGSNDYST